MVGIKIVDYILGGIMSELLKVNNLSVAIDDTEILKNIDFTIGTGETHVLMGPNGAGNPRLHPYGQPCIRDKEWRYNS